MGFAAVRDDPDIAALLVRYLAEVRRAGSPLTERAYRNQLRPAVGFWSDRGISRVEQLREEHVEAYQDTLVDRELKPRSRALAATALRMWLRWLGDRGLIEWTLTRAVTTVRIPRGRARPIRRRDLEQVLDYLAELGPESSVTELRDRAMLAYCLSTGARISEALQVPRDGYQDVEVRQKGGGPKRLLAPEAVCRLVDEYLRRRSDDVRWLWVTTERGKAPHRLTAAAANLRWRRLARILHLPPWTTHQLRDTGATLLVRQQLPTHLIADHLGHADLHTVQKYLEVEDEDRAPVAEAMDALFAKIPPARRLRSGVKLEGRPDLRPGTRKRRPRR